MAEVKKPEFGTAEVASVSEKYYCDEQMALAKFSRFNQSSGVTLISSE